jgi:hypothetical protein
MTNQQHIIYVNDMIIINNNDVDEMENLKNYLTSNSKFDMKDLEGKSIF